MLARRHARERSRRAEARTGCATHLAAPLVGVLLAAVVLAGALLWVNLTAGLPAPERLTALLDPGRGTLLQPTRLYYRDGQTPLYSLENPGIPRRYLWLDPQNPDHFSPLLVQVVVSAVDPTFWSHPGFTWSSLLARQPETLAERLVDTLLLEDEALGWRRTLRGRLLAAQITRRYGRVQVLEWYLNSAGYGHLAYGVDSAARLYLNKSAAELDLAEAALLVGVEQAPALNPLDAPQAALDNQRAVLDRLLELGMISQADYLAARAEVLAFSSPSGADPVDEFTRLALARLEARFGRARLERGGLRIVTTLDVDLQMEVDCAARSQLARLAQSGAGSAARSDGQPCSAARLLPAQAAVPGLPDGARAGALVLDLETGEVLAYAGGTGQAAAQPGSLLTPFVALSGFARGMGPASLVWDIPESLPAGLEGAPNPGGAFRGPQRLRTALANDSLAPFAHLLEQIGARSVWQLAAPLGLRGLERESDAQGLIYRGGDVPPLEIAQAYAVFARLGAQTGETGPSGGQEPVLVRSVQAVEGTLLQAAPDARAVNVISQELAYLVHDILRDPSARQGQAASLLDIDRPSAGKLGQADGGRQVWAVGYTPQRLALAWMSTPPESEPVLPPATAGGLWRAAILTAVDGLPVADWSAPPGVTRVEVCDPSGLLPTAVCPDVVEEVFVSGSEPQATDTLYRSVQINRETGRLATVFTPPGLVDERVFLVAPPEARAWAESAGLPQPPEDYDAIRPAAEQPGARLDSPPLFAALRGPVEIRGTAAGEDFVSYRLEVGQGLNPRAWLTVGEEQFAPVENGLLGVWDTAGLDGLWAVRLQVERGGNRLSSAVIQVTVDNSPPEARVIYPAEGGAAQPSPQGTLTLQAEVSDNIGVTRVEWLVDGRGVGESFAAPYQLPWAARRGRHTLSVAAYDAAGNRAESTPVTFEVP